MPDRRLSLPGNFRALPLSERLDALRREVEASPEEWEAVSGPGDALELADLMVESAIGCVALPLGLATGFLIDGVSLDIPMATEEPSVVAAASFSGRLVAGAGGFETWAAEPIMSAQVFLEEVGDEGFGALLRAEGAIAEALTVRLGSLQARGGGFRAARATRLPETGLVRVDISVDVRDALGANILNGAAESLRPLLERLTGGRALMCILSNAAAERRAGARFSLPLGTLGRALAPGWKADDAARRIALASALAKEDPSRAVTHNKGIMNGIIALSLATFNDSRAVEAAAHAWACRDGRYRGLGDYRVEDGALRGELELPLALASVGGAVGFHPAGRLALAILGKPDARRLARIAAALGLAQNLAALLALATGGIQRGHMRYHAARLAYQAGARGDEVRRVAALLAERGLYSLAEARAIVEGRRAGREGETG